MRFECATKTGTLVVRISKKKCVEAIKSGTTASLLHNAFNRMAEIHRAQLVSIPSSFTTIKADVYRMSRSGELVKLLKTNNCKRKLSKLQMRNIVKARGTYDFKKPEDQDRFREAVKTFRKQLGQ